MKKLILIVAILGMVFTLTGCDFSKQTYKDELETSEWVKVKSYFQTDTYLCSDLESIKVLPGGALEIIDDDGYVYIVSNNWQLEFYDD